MLEPVIGRHHRYPERRCHLLDTRPRTSELEHLTTNFPRALARHKAGSSLPRIPGNRTPLPPDRSTAYTDFLAPSVHAPDVDEERELGEAVAGIGVARIEPEGQTKAGERVRLSVRPELMHYFEPRSGMTIR